MSADRLTELLSWVILAAGLALAAGMVYTAHVRFEQTWETYQTIPMVPK